jgi:transposase
MVEPLRPARAACLLRGRRADASRPANAAGEGRDPDPKALCAYGLLVRSTGPDGEADERVLLRFVDGRAVSSITTRFLDWSLKRLQRMGKRALLLIWDNASWHKSREVENWISSHNRRVKESGSGVRIVSCLLPVKSPWLNPIEPMWVHGKRKVIKPDGSLSAHELADRVCGVFGCEHEPHLSINQEVA